MNNTDISYLMNMLNKMDKNQVTNGLNRLNQILSPEEKQKVANYERLIYLAMEYRDDITSEAHIKILNDYQEYMTKLELLNPNEQNQNILNALNNSNQIFKSLEEKQKSLDMPMILERKLENGMDTRKGFTNASIIIFIVLLLGIIASVLLIIAGR